MRYLKIEMKVLVVCFFYDLISWLPYTMSDNAEIIIVVTCSHSLQCSGNGRIKNPSELSGFLESRDLF